MIIGFSVIVQLDVLRTFLDRHDIQATLAAGLKTDSLVPRARHARLA
jgi:hypothetical protein